MKAGTVWTEAAIDNKMSTLIFRSSLKRQVYSSDPYKILNLLGDIGGYLELIMALGFAMAHYFV